MRQRVQSTQRCKRIGKRIGEGSGSRCVSDVLYVALTREHRQHQAAQAGRQRRRAEERRECYRCRLLIVGCAKRPAEQLEAQSAQHECADRRIESVAVPKDRRQLHVAEPKAAVAIRPTCSSRISLFECMMVCRFGTAAMTCRASEQRNSTWITRSSELSQLLGGGMLQQRNPMESHGVKLDAGQAAQHRQRHRLLDCPTANQLQQQWHEAQQRMSSSDASTLLDGQQRRMLPCHWMSDIIDHLSIAHW